jgi:hypothetical protein
MRLQVGRLSIYFEPRDIWVGVFMGPSAIYVCPLPMLVVRWWRCTPPTTGGTDER